MVRPISRYTLEVLPSALKSLDVLPRPIRGSIGYSMELLQRDFSGDVKSSEDLKTSIDCGLVLTEFALS
jgi:hypothetical protein